MATGDVEHVSVDELKIRIRTAIDYIETMTLPGETRKTISNALCVMYALVTMLPELLAEISKLMAATLVQKETPQ